MPRPEKVQEVEYIKQRIDAAPAVFLTEYRGLSVPEQEQLRAGLREAGADYKVVKMTLAAIASQSSQKAPSAPASRRKAQKLQCCSQILVKLRLRLTT